MLNVIKFIHLLSIVVWLGMLFFFTFVGAPAVFKTLPKDLAGDVVGSIFPKYWVIGYITSLAALFTLIAQSIIEKGFPWVRILLLVVMTVTTFYSGVYVGTKARDLKIEIRAVEDLTRKEDLTSQFKIVHFKSSALNMAVIVLGIVLIYFTSVRLTL